MRGCQAFATTLAGRLAWRRRRRATTPKRRATSRPRTWWGTCEGTSRMPIIAVGAVVFALGVALGQATAAPAWVGFPLGLIGLGLLYRGPRRGLAFIGTLLSAGLVAGS